MATDPNAPPPEPVVPLSTPPNPGEVQTTPMPMVVSAFCNPLGGAHHAYRL